MDPLTHTATGLFLSRAGLGRKLPHASWILALAANAPDIDIIALAGGSLTYLDFHRHLTHSLAAMPAMALLAVLVVRAFARGPFPWLRAWLAALAAVASHLALDFTNVYGIRLLLPFSARWFRADLTPVIDLLIWAVCLVALAGPFMARLVNAEIGARGGGGAAGRGWAWLALAFLLLYNCGRGVLHERAVATLESRLYEGAAPARVAAFPGPNPLRWHGLVETPEFYSVQEVDLAGGFNPASGRTFYKPEASAALEAAPRTPVFQRFLGFAQFPLWRSTPLAEPENGVRVEVFDMRFGSPAEPGFMAGVDLDARLQPLRAWFRFGRAKPR